MDMSTLKCAIVQPSPTSILIYEVKYGIRFNRSVTPPQKNHQRYDQNRMRSNDVFEEST